MKKKFIIVFAIAYCYVTGIAAQDYNTKLGDLALAHNTTGDGNTAIGRSTLFGNTTGSGNTVLGAFSMLYSLGGSYNTATGYYSLNHNKAFYNTAYGAYSLEQNIDGASNTAVGYYSLNANTDGNYNTATGHLTLWQNTNGYSNTANGYRSLNANITGSQNTGIGYQSLYSNSSGLDNTAVGYFSLHNNSGGEYNTAIGSKALSKSGGDLNTAVGAGALQTNTTGSNNTALGYGADVTKEKLKNATAIGYKAKVNASNKVRIGNTAVTSIGGQVGWSTFSDGRYKRDIKENIPGLVFINSLRPVSYTVNVKGLNDYYDKGRERAADKEVVNSEIVAAMQQADNAASRIVHSGFVAQEVEEAAKKLNYDFDGVDKPENKEDLYGLRYENFIVPLVKAVQELSRQNEDLQKQVAELKAIIKENAQTSNISFSDASLEQNIPNPFNKTTTIRYNLPQKYANAQIVITDKNGNALKQINISGNHKGTVSIDAATLAAGAYQYALVVDGRRMASKQMVLAK